MAKVLILESDKVLAQNLGYILRRKGYQVSWAGGPQAGIEKVDSWRPDVIVMDLILGGHGGIEFLYELRSYPEWQKLPVVIFSSLAANELAGHEAELGQLDIAAHFYKPEATLSEVADAVERAGSLQAQAAHKK
jgi:CheY-like chemotaxis protein